MQVDEQHEGGTLSSTVYTEATLSLRSVMAKVAAHAAVGTGQARLLDADFNAHEAEVITAHYVNLTFEATIHQDSESVDLTLVGIEEIEPILYCYVCHKMIDPHQRRIRWEGVTRAPEQSTWIWGPVPVHEDCRLRLRTPFDDCVGSDGYISTWELLPTSKRPTHPTH